ncbi:DUF1273 domain-containing protein [Rossellomorea vietnamensis]|uniref:UPF0398 protein FZC84_20765 n=1 Tax=Rossellomorea vietnamensis TaxID=218284 RepID=A0A5D4M2B9_9BACI|nr:DUF1273 domain-containing protein [Rossellomorea vietnamensis]TYR96084.1 DUF1273 domain-containing protein [Rossellomorea vietnamensis]
MGLVAAVTGYKSYELGIFKEDEPALQYIKAAIQKQLESLLEDDLEWVLISGQMGTELWAAEVVFDLQIEYPDLKLAILTPFLNQKENWNENNKEYYEMITSQADFVDSVSKQPYTSPAQFRNRDQLFLHKSDALIILYDEEKEGSPQYFYKAAKEYKESHPLDIRQITFMDLQWIVEEEQYNTID